MPGSRGNSILNSQIKAIAAAAGGAVGGGVAGGIVLPDGSPWYAYVIVIAITALTPYLSNWFAPKNAR
ncbi:MAG: hypothetical protein ACRC67_28455 [Inquilinus sp.]|uniref:hypothetical protein n=1 Tax=Inquilinus sp. TaxID=1932117 RepID=UPI003F3A12AE